MLTVELVYMQPTTSMLVLFLEFTQTNALSRIDLENASRVRVNLCLDNLDGYVTLRFRQTDGGAV